jgi:hypothetical protein
LEENLSPHHMKIKSNKKNCCVLNGICEWIPSKNVFCVS